MVVQKDYGQITEELNEVVHTWNTHKLRPRPAQYVHGGRPVLMYTVPSLYDAQDKLKPVDADEVALCKE